MSRDKQIKEMALDLNRIIHFKDNGLVARYATAEAMYELGYHKHSEWISVEDRLPEKQCSYLCCYIFEDFPDHKYYNVLDYYLVDEHPHFQHEGGITRLRVTHWMPLPSPPTEKNA